MKKMVETAQSLLKNCLEIKKDESILILYHTPYQDIAAILHQECSKKVFNTFKLEIPDKFYKDNFTNISKFLGEMDAIIALTDPSISFWDSRIQANQNGARIICLPNITDSSFVKLAKTNFKRIHYLSKKISDILSISKVVSLTCPNGTNLTIPITNHEGFAETGLVNAKGTFSNLPAGEACIVPETCDGEFVVDNCSEMSKDDPDKLVIHIKDGRAVRISGGNSAKRLRQKLAKMGPESRKIIEFGIGTNESLKNSGNPLEDQKVLGNIHITLGQYPSQSSKMNQMFPIHLISYKSTVELRGKKIIDKGKLMLDV